MTEPRFLAAWSTDEGAARAANGFRARFGEEPTGVWAAPGRVNLIGEHTDYNGGLCLPIALPHRTYFAAKASSDDAARLTSAQIGGEVFELPMSQVAPGAVSGWGAYAVGVVWALRRHGLEVPAPTGHVDSCVPFGAGLSSSAALEAAVALAVLDLLDEFEAAANRATANQATADGVARNGSGLIARSVRAGLATACVEAENRIAGAPTGGMDQAAALLTADGYALLLDSATGEDDLVPFDPAAAGLELLVIDTRASHALVDGQYGQRRKTCAEAAAALGLENLGQLSIGDLPRATVQLGGPDTLAARRVRHVVTEIDRTRQFADALREGRIAETGPLLDQSHCSMRDDYEISCPELDLATEVAREAGALGARMTGGGFGGSAIALVRQGQSARIAAAVVEAFESAGMTEPVFLLAEPSGPGQRLA
ncbi:MAG: galactokinase [Bifidobacteriaceae bacterium]|jgi:galactokinase|nr:galactokinase [Bifidobacteriaceae bacterium]